MSSIENHIHVCDIPHTNVSRSGTELGTKHWPYLATLNGTLVITSNPVHVTPRTYLHETPLSGTVAAGLPQCH